MFEATSNIASSAVTDSLTVSSLRVDAPTLAILMAAFSSLSNLVSQLGQSQTLFVKGESSTMPSCLVIGGGISGLIAARVLQHRGIKVTVLDKGRGIGGRCIRLYPGNGC